MNQILLANAAITDFAPASTAEHSLLHRSPGGQLLGTTEELSPDLVRRLRPHQCAMIMPEDGRPRSHDELSIFTLSKLRWHDNPTSGVYVAINDFVYDLTGWS